MRKIPISRTPHRSPRRLALSVAGCLTLVACVSGPNTEMMEGIGFREARYNQIALMRQYRECRNEGLELDKRARISGSAGTYLASARVLEKCETGIGPDGAGLAVDERMRAYALSIQNNFKGGDVEKARTVLDRYKERFSGQDLYYPDGTSFLSTMDSLLGRKEKWSFGEFAALNVNATLKGEMRRLLHWQNR